MELSNNKNEIELIKKYQQKHNNEIALYFFDKFKDAALNIISSKINNKFSSIPLEREDFCNAVWKSVKLALASFDVEKKKLSCLFNYVVSQSYWLSLREASKFLKNSHIVLNTAYSYEKALESNKQFAESSRSNGLSYEDVVKNFINNVLEFNHKYSKQKVERVIYLKSIGHSLSDISKITKYPINVVRGIIGQACDIAKELYK